MHKCISDTKIIAKNFSLLYQLFFLPETPPPAYFFLTADKIPSIFSFTSRDPPPPSSIFFFRERKPTSYFLVYQQTPPAYFYLPADKTKHIFLYKQISLLWTFKTI